MFHDMFVNLQCIELMHGFEVHGGLNMQTA